MIDSSEPSRHQSDVRLETAVGIAIGVCHDMAHIEPMAAQAVRWACSEIIERLKGSATINPRKGRRASEITARVRDMQVGQVIEFTSEDAVQAAEIGRRVTYAVTNIQFRYRQRYSRAAIPGGFRVTRIA